MNQHSFDITDLSTPDLETIVGILRKYSQDTAELAEAGEFRFSASGVAASTPASGSRRR